MGPRFPRWTAVVIGLVILLTPILTTARSVHAQESESDAPPLATPIAPVQVDEDGSITITGRMCPEEYAGDEYAADCTDVPPAGTEFSRLNDGQAVDRVVIDGNGVAVLPLPAAVIPGPVGLSFTLPGAYYHVDSVVACVDQAGAPVPVSYVEPHWVVEVGAGGAIVGCAWYFIPDRFEPGDPATVAFINLICPAGYEGENYAADCTTPAGAGKRFFIAVTVSPVERISVVHLTEPDGTVAIPIPYAHEILPATIFVGQTFDPKTGETPEELDPFVATCSRNDGAEDVPFEIESANSIAIDALVDDAVTCLWYNLPAAEEPGSPTPTPTPTPTQVPGDPTPTATATATPERTPITQLPSTGTGDRQP